MLVLTVRNSALKIATSLRFKVGTMGSYASVQATAFTSSRLTPSVGTRAEVCRRNTGAWVSTYRTVSFSNSSIVVCHVM